MIGGEFSETGNGIFIGTSTAVGNPLTDVWGDSKSNVLSDNTIKIVLNSDGKTFKKIITETNQGQEVEHTIEEYNAIFKSKPVWN